MKPENLLAELDELLERLRQFREKLELSMTQEGDHLQLNLFGVSGDMEGVNAKDCCLRILREKGNRPMNALTLAREALGRGYKGGASGSPDDVLMTTAKSFWARLCRDSRFEEIRPQVFILSEGRK